MFICGIDADTSSFNVHGVLYVGDEEKIAPVEREIRELSSTLQLVKDEQAYLVVRERVHRDSEFLPDIRNTPNNRNTEFALSLILQSKFGLR